MKAELVPENGDPPIPITRDVTVVGRREYCDIQVDDRSLSKRHAVIVKTDGLLVIRDLATTNGTKVKGQRVRWAARLPDDRIAFGSYKVRIYLGPDDAPGPSELAKMGRRQSTQLQTAPAGNKAKPAPAPAPAPAARPIPVGGDDDLELVDDDSDDDSGWRQLLDNKRGGRGDDDDVVIELD